MANAVTSLSDLRKYAKGSLIRLPDFGPGQPFYARLTRPSLMELAKNGEIPNGLLISANKLFGGGKVESGDEQALPQIYEIIEVLCKSVFLEPTYKQIIESGLHLTDEQLVFVLQYAQKGVEALRPFPGERENLKPVSGRPETTKKAE